jgi:SAM-dependent methyltransferase
MSIFNAYSKYYDLLYKDKDYASEAEYVHNLIQKHMSGAKTILDLGCGTGRHDILLAEKGYTITGVDISEDMISMARTNLSNNKSKLGSLANKISFTNPTFLCEDIRTIRLQSTFDAVISLFHVMSYQTTNTDLQEAFTTVRTHLNPGGIFIFDCWHGPAVLTERPSVRIKRIEDEEIHVTRFVEPEIHPNDNIVDVNYQIFVHNKREDSFEEIQETHRMRYLFLPEIELLLTQSGLKLLKYEEWISGKQLSLKTWNACYIAMI